MKYKVLALILLVLLAVTACTANPPIVDPNPTPDPNPVPDPAPNPDPAEFDFERYQPNELGRIPVFMYHGISSEESEWVRTAENFRADLQRFYDLGYRLVSMTDLIENNIDIPAGTSPMILTFDDGLRNNFNLVKTDGGEIVLDPDSAVAIILEFAERHPEMGTAATFYLNFPNPFSQNDSWYTREHRDYKLRQLVEWGMEIGNHTYSHPHLTNNIKSESELIAQLGRPQEFLYTVLPGHKMNSLALPFGSRPKDEWKHHLYSGTYNNVEYHHDIVLLVGAHPGYAPNHRQYTPLAMPRIRASNYGVPGNYLDKALEQLASTRYISDGDPDIITIPESMQQYLDEDSLNGKTLRVYE